MNLKKIEAMLKIKLMVITCILIGLSNAFAQVQDKDEVHRQLLDKAQEEEFVSVIIEYDMDFRPFDIREKQQMVQDQSNTIQNMSNSILDSINQTEYEIHGITEFKYSPYLALDIGSEGLEYIIQLDQVKRVHKNKVNEVNLSESTEIVGSDFANEHGFEGEGQSIAILDSGMDLDHRFYSDRIIAGACFSGSRLGYSSLCPSEEDVEIGIEAGQNCDPDIDSDCHHGTHVGGIAVSNDEITHLNGIAPKANLIPIQVTSENFFGSIISATSDQIQALEWLYENVEELELSVVNMSLGDGSEYSEHCDDDPRKVMIDNLRDSGVATVIAAGNEGNEDGLAYPACISSAISVGSTQTGETYDHEEEGEVDTELDAISDFSNTASYLDLLAPGEPITSSIVDGGVDTFPGTSMAAPMVSGAFALLNEKFPNESVDQHLQRLKDTGEPILDDRNNEEFPRIQIDEALELGAIVELQDGNIEPAAGTDSDNFTFEVDYSSTDDEPADEVTLVIDQFQEYTMTPEGDNWEQGVTYITERDDLDPGEYEVHFEATYEDQEIRFPESGYLTLNVSIDAEGWDLAVRSADASPGVVSPDQTISVETQIVNEGDNTYTNEPVTGTLISPDGVELDDDQFVIDEIVPSRSQTYDELSLTVPSGVEDGVYDVRVEVNPERDEDPTNNVFTAQVFVGEPEFTEQFIVEEWGKFVCNADDTDPICDTYGEITIGGNTYDIGVSGTTDNAVIEGPSGTQIFEEHEIIWWDEIQAGVVLDFVGQFPDANLAEMHTVEMTTQGPDFESYAQSFIKGEESEMKVDRGGAPSFTTSSPDFFIEYDTRSDPEGERDKFNDWSQGSPDLENGGQIAKYPFEIPSDVDSGTERVFMRTTHDDERYISQVSFEIIGTPTIAYDPEEFNVDSKTNESASEILEIQNTGDETLNWSLEANENWISLSEESNSVSSGDDQQITVTFDATDLEPGDYESTLQLTSNDPDQSSISIPVDFEVNPLPISLPDKDLVAEEGNEEVALKWDEEIVTIMPVDEELSSDQNSADIESYRIYRDTDSDDLEELVEVEKEDEHEIYTDTEVENDQTYYYGVRALGEYGQESELSEIVEATPFDPEDLLATVTGTVIGENSDPVSEARLYALEDEEPVDNVTTDENGEYELQLEAGSYDIGVYGVKHRSFYSSEWSQMELEESEETSIDFDVRDGMHLGVEDIRLNGGGDILQINHGDEFNLHKSSQMWAEEEVFVVIGNDEEALKAEAFPPEEYPGELKSLDINISDIEDSGGLYAAITDSENEEGAISYYENTLLDAHIPVAFVQVLDECQIDWQLALGIDADPGDHQTLLGGQSPDASDGIDDICGQEVIGSELPDDEFGAGWKIPDEDKYTVVDYRSDEAAAPVEWEIEIKTYSETSSVELQWDPELLPEQNIELLDKETGGDYLSLNMNENDHVLIDQDDIGGSLDEINLVIRSSDLKEVVVEHDEGWRMGSAAAMKEEGQTAPAYEELYPEALQQPFSYTPQDGYQFTEQLDVGIGYWLRFDEAHQWEFEGYAADEVDVDLEEGWNIIGSTSFTTPVDEAIEDPDELIIGGPFDNDYMFAEDMIPGQGYWVRAEGEGAITLTSQADEQQIAGVQSAGEAEAIAGRLGDHHRLEVSPGEGEDEVVHRLYFGGEVSEAQKQTHAVPPLPPGERFDARFDDNRRVSESLTPEISLQSSEWPVTVQLNENSALFEDEGHYRLQVYEDGEKQASYDLIDGEGVLVSDPGEEAEFHLRFEEEAEAPSEFALKQNYPNPFNPVTEIEYHLPEDEHVHLRVYDIQGRQVATLVDEDQSAGVHTATFNSEQTGVASGVYMYRLEVGSYSEVRQMTLIK